MTDNRLYNDIISRLEQPLNDKLFERFAVDFLCHRGHDAALIPGGSDDGMDIAIFDGEGEPYPGTVTTSSRVIGNMTDNLKQYKCKGRPSRKCIVVTSDSLTATRIKHLYKRARELDFTLVQVYAQNEIAAYLHRDARWLKDLLRLTGSPSALSKEPPTHRPFLDRNLIAREDALDWLRVTEGDRLLVGEPGAGKTSLLYQLAKEVERAAWFVRTRDEREIANAIREIDPKILMLDDPFNDEEFIKQMMRLRNDPDINGDFSFIVTCWNGEREKLEPIVSEQVGNTYKLRRLIQDDMVKVINEAGIKDNIWLVNEIVRQAAGLSGLAVTLADLASRGGVEKIQTAQALSNAILQFYESVIEQPVRVMLAGFALGGNAGMNTDTVSEILDIRPGDLHESLRGLASGGVIAEVSNRPDYIKVRPDALRHALICDVFFSGARSMPSSVRDALIAETPNPKDTALEIIGAKARAKARGGEFPTEFLETHIQDLETKLWEEYRQMLSALPPDWKEKLPTSRSTWLAYEKLHKVWEEYASLGYYEARWVIEYFTGKVSLIAPPLLHFIPRLAIPKLLHEAIHDRRERLHSYPDHPLRRLQDWIKGAFPQSSGTIRRRDEMLRGTQRWLTETEKNDAVVGYKAMLFAMIPDFQRTLPDPGSGNTVQYYWGGLTENELLKTQQFWAEIMKCTRVVEVPDWHVFLPTIEEWLRPSGRYSAEAYEVLHSFAMKMARDVAEAAADHIGVMHSLQKLMPDLEIHADDVFNTLYPIEKREADWKKQEENWTQAADELVDAWITREPAEVIAQLESIELAFRQAHRPWPWLTPYVCRRLAEKTSDPLVWFDVMLPTTLPADTIAPFLLEAIRCEVNGWQQALRASFETERLRGIAVHIILSNENIPEDLKQEALIVAGQYTSIVEQLVRANRLSREVLLELFHHPDKVLVGKLAIAGRPRKDVRSVADDIRPLWEQAIIEYCEDDYWLEVIFKVETELGLKWLKRKLSDGSFKRSDYSRSVERVLTRANLVDRGALLEIVPDGYFYTDTIAGIVGDDLELYKLLLQQRDREESTLLSPLHRSLDSVWEAFAKLAHGHGHTPEEIAEYTIARSNSGKLTVGRFSEAWKTRCDQFEALKNHEDRIICQVARFGYQKSLENYEYWKKREDDEDVYGRD